MRASVALVSWLLVPALGCSATVADDDEVTDAPVGSTQGTVTVERLVTVVAGSDAERISTRVLARFVQVSGGVDHAFAEQVVGSPRDLPAVGACELRSTTSLDPLPTVASDGAIDLLDVGDVVLHAGDRSMPLAPRAFPDVGDLVSGIVYSSRDDTTALPPDEPYEIETTGSELADGFRLNIDAPGAPEQVRLADAELDAADIAIQLGEPLSIQWAAGQDARDIIIVELTPVDSEQRQPHAVRCVFDDAGSATVPEPFITWSEELEGMDVSIHRFRRVLLKAPEIDEAVVEFDFAVAARLPVTYSQ